MRHVFDTHIELDVEIRGYYRKGRRSDYWNPAEPEEVEDFGVFLDGNEITHLLTDKQIDKLVDDFIESAQEQDYDDAGRWV